MQNIHYHTDLCVVGGGLAGLCAAVSAARNGIKVVLMQDRPVLGGNASSEIRMWVCGAENTYDRETGILEELFLENYYRNPNLSYSIWDSVLYGIAKQERNLVLLLNCSCMDAQMEGDRITAVTGWQMTTERRIQVTAKIFADCSGDGILAPLTGAEFMLGREARSAFGESLSPEQADSKTMGQSCIMQLREYSTKQEFIPPEWAYKYAENDEMMARREHVLSKGQNFWWIEVGGIGDILHETEENRDELLKIAFGIWDHIKNQGRHKDAENWAIDWIGFLPGKRESRRFVGQYIMNQEDIENGTSFEDAVAYGGWPLDDHHPEGIYYSGDGCTQIYVAKSYGIPYRSLVAKRIENLGFAGRNISVTHTALSSTRVMATCAIMGQSLGTAAAMAVQHGCLLKEVDVHALQQQLLYDDCYIPGIRREVSALTKAARTNAEILRSGIDRETDGTTCNQYIGGKNEKVYYRYTEPVYISEVRIIFNSRLEREYDNMPASYPLVQPDYKMPETLVKKFQLYIRTEEGTSLLYETDANFKRMVKIPVNRMAEEVILIPEETWGDEKIRIFAMDII